MNKLVSVVIGLGVIVTVFSICAYETNILLTHVDKVISHLQNITSTLPNTPMNETQLKDFINGYLK